MSLCLCEIPTAEAGTETSPAAHVALPRPLDSVETYRESPPATYSVVPVALGVVKASSFPCLVDAHEAEESDLRVWHVKMCPGRPPRNTIVRTGSCV